MARPRMIVVAGPPGSGKTRYLPVSAFGIDWFNIDDRCAQILGSYRAIPRHVRRAVAAECERFVLDHTGTTRNQFDLELSSARQAYDAAAPASASSARKSPEGSAIAPSTIAFARTSVEA